MKNILYIILCGYVIFFTVGCPNSFYKTIIVENGQTIPSYCSAWEDKCNIYCRTGPTNYKKIENTTKCEGRDTVRFTCIDEFPEKISRCSQSK